CVVKDVVAEAVQPLCKGHLAAPDMRIVGGRTPLPAPVPRDVEIALPHELTAKFVLMVERDDPAARKDDDALPARADDVLTLLCGELLVAGGKRLPLPPLVFADYAARKGERILRDGGEDVHVASARKTVCKGRGERHAAV